MHNHTIIEPALTGIEPVSIREIRKLLLEPTGSHPALPGRFFKDYKIPIEFGIFKSNPILSPTKPSALKQPFIFSC